MTEISIEGLDKAELLAALYNRSHQFGMGFMNCRGRVDMTVEQARAIIDPKSPPDPRMFEWDQRDAWELKFDYLYGRVMKVNLSGDTLRTALYNRDLGHGAAERIVAALRASKAVADAVPA